MGRTTKETLKSLLETVVEQTGQDLTLEWWSNGQRNIYQIFIPGESDSLQRQVGPNMYANEAYHYLKGIIDSGDLPIEE